MKLLNQMQWKHPATLEHVDQVCTEAQRLLDSLPIIPSDRFAIELLLREELVNAVVHGCRENPQMQVTGCLKVMDREVIIETLDQGGGFNWKSTAARKPEGLDERGRGLAIYELYATEYQFNEAGNRITLRRTLQKEEMNG